MNTLREACEVLPGWLQEPPPRPPDFDEVAWDLVRSAVQAHGVAPALHRRLTGPGWRESAFGAWLGEQAAVNLRRVERLLGELDEILERFGRAGVATIPLKGAVVIPLFYGAGEPRPMNDLDLLVRRRDLAAARGLLEELGYEQVFCGWKHRRFLRPGNRRVVDASCEHPDNPRPVEVHPRCRERIADEVVDLTERVWDSARRSLLRGREVPVPSLELLWLHLVIHTTHHVLLNTFRLVQLLDLARVTARVEAPAALLESIDPRAAYPSLALLDSYTRVPAAAGLRARQRSRVADSYAAWADGLDLFTASYLHPAPWRAS